MDPLFIFLGLVALIIIGGLFFMLGHGPQGQSQSNEKIEGTNFIPSQMIMGSDGLGGLAVNERTEQICLFTSPTTPPRLLPLTDLVSSSVIKNGELLGEGKRRFPDEIVSFSNELKRQKDALIKSLHINSANGSNQRIDLLVVVHDTEDPLHVVNFLDMETKEGGILYEKALSTATHWHNVLDVLILEADRLAQHSSASPEEKELAGATS